MSLRIGVDTGGTFTDVCAYDDVTGRIHVRKVSSTPDDPGRAIVRGLGELLDQIGGRTTADIGYFAHGTTVGTNALLTGGGVRTGLITTLGFRDMLELGRGRRPDMYDAQADKPVPFVPRDLRLEVTERVRHDGRVEIPLDEDEVRAAVRELRARDVVSIAVCLLYSYVRPDHERMIGEIIRSEFPEAHVSLSSEVLPEFREFERLSTVVTNAYVGPVVADYLTRLRGTLAASGLACEPHVTQSNGGIIPFTTAERLPVRLVLSGPSTGVVGAAAICSAAGFPDVITFDMGGTSSDVSLVRQGEPKLTASLEIGGRPVRSPMLDIHTVGAGGGSIAWIDSGGHLRVGPASAGAFPGPACYGNGDDATVTDANVVLGVLNPEYLLDGQLKIDREAAHRAVGRLADRLGLSVPATAQGIVDVVTANMARAIRVISVHRGYDPLDYALVPFGGAGPLHAARLAAELGCGTVLVPEIPGAQSALGLLMTDVRSDFLRTRRVPATDVDAIAGVLGDLSANATGWFDAEAVDPDRRSVTRGVDLRYAGQNYELGVDVPDGPVTEATVALLVDDFHAVHERMYGYRLTAPVEAVTFRVQAVGAVARAEIVRSTPRGRGVRDAVVAHRPVYLPETGGQVDCPVYDRAGLDVGHRITGPAIVEQLDSTTLLLPGDVCDVDELRNLVVRTPGATGRRELDGVLVEVIGSALATIVEEMSGTLVKAAFSTNIKERRDCTAGLFDVDGNGIAQDEGGSPLHLGSLMGIVGSILERYDDIEDGDTFIGNDPYNGGGSHLPDIVLASPIFVDGQLTAWAATLAHHADFGDRGHAHIFQEGLRIPPVRLVRAGVQQEELLSLILLNCQVPDERLADLRAQRSANRLAVLRYRELCARYGTDVVARAGGELLDHTERRTRTAIAAMPDGSYSYSDLFDCPELDEELRLRVAVRIAGDEISFDFAGNPPQVRASVNVVWTALYATVYYAVKSLIDADITPNAGLYRAIHIDAPTGSIVHCAYPAAVNGRSETCQRIVDLIHGALAAAVPERVTAAGNGANTGVHFSGHNPSTGKDFVYLETFGGGSGARATKDGLDGVQVHMTNTSNLPVESLETEYPLLVEAYELIDDSGGAGEFRGGLGIRRRIRVEGENVHFWLDTSRQKSRPWGLFGGTSGAVARAVPSDGARPIDHGYTVLGPGDTIAVETAGAGGYGSPADRTEEAVGRDVAESRISRHTAKTHYPKQFGRAG
jgi:N-methylhydantoinase A/oxoprolinase/acetone carboxylase beta subunit/N-methylhydantoinase B/oxoprolinase/acetone carboxylase alpha subunit